MRTKFIRLATVFLICLAGTPQLGLSQTVSAAPHQARKQQGFFDYALDKVDPSGKDYGSLLQGGRDALVSNTVDDLYFWSNVLTLVVLTASVVTILLQLRSIQKRDVIAASLIAELWNGRVSDRIELDRRTTQYNELVEAHNSEVEKALALKAQPSDQAKEAHGNLTQSVQRLAGKGSSATARDTPRPQSSGSTATLPTAESTGLNLKESNLLLQRQVEAMQNNEQNLKQRLNQTTLLLDQERRRNATLKGA